MFYADVDDGPLVPDEADGGDEDDGEEEDTEQDWDQNVGERGLLGVNFVIISAIPSSSS